MLRSKRRGAIPPLPEYVFLAWCLVKHRDIFTFSFTFTLVRTVEFISDRMSYVILRGLSCNIVLNVRAPTEDESDYTEDGI
jgi:hypothetical protein